MVVWWSLLKTSVSDSRLGLLACRLENKFRMGHDDTLEYVIFIITLGISNMRNL